MIRGVSCSITIRTVFGTFGVQCDMPVLYCTVMYCVQAHSEQITAPINNKKGNKLASVNHSFSEPDLLRLFSKYRWLISRLSTVVFTSIRQELQLPVSQAQNATELLVNVAEV